MENVNKKVGNEKSGTKGFVACKRSFHILKSEKSHAIFGFSKSNRGINLLWLLLLRLFNFI